MGVLWYRRLGPKAFCKCATRAFSLRDIYFAALAKNQLSAQIHAGRWTDIGDLEEYAAVRDGGLEKIARYDPTLVTLALFATGAHNYESLDLSSILAADFTRLGDEVRAVLDAGADTIHFDVMDNHYVPNLSIGPLVLSSLRKAGFDAVIDVHLMVKPVDRLIATFWKPALTTSPSIQNRPSTYVAA